MEQKVKTPGSDITIRPAQKKDVQPFRELRLEALRDHPEAFGSDYVTDLARPLDLWIERLESLGRDGMIYFAESRGNLIGMCGIYRRDSPKVRHSAMIWGVYVQPEWRGRRVAGRLIEACLDWGRTHGITVVKLAVVTTNNPAIHCYLRCGFTVYGIEPKVIFSEGQYYDELLLVKVFKEA